MAYKIQNLVVTANLNCEINMDYLNFSLPDFNYNKQRFNGGILKLQDPKCTFLIFRTGKVVCLACKTMEDVHSSMNRLIDLLPEFNVRLTDIKIVNVVGSYNFGRRIRILDLAREIPHATYEPEIYPAVIIKENSSTVLIFHTGKIIITGCKSISGSFHMFQVMERFITKYPNL